MPGGSTVKAAAPLGTIPAYVREGAIIPRGDIVRLNNNWDAELDSEAAPAILSLGRGKSQFDYYTGSGVQRIAAEPAGDGLKIEFGELGAPGTIEVYCKEVTGVTRNGVKLRAGTDYHYDQASHKLTISFQGASKIAIAGAGSLF